MRQKNNMDKTICYLVVENRISSMWCHKIPIAIFYSRAQAEFFAHKNKPDNAGISFNYTSLDIEEVPAKTIELSGKEYDKFKAEKIKELDDKIEKARAHKDTDDKEIAQLQTLKESL